MWLGFVFHSAFQSIAETLLEMFLVGFHFLFKLFQAWTVLVAAPRGFGNSHGAGVGHVHQQFAGGNPFRPHAEVDSLDVLDVILVPSVAGIEVVAVFQQDGSSAGRRFRCAPFDGPRTQGSNRRSGSPAPLSRRSPTPRRAV